MPHVITKGKPPLGGPLIDELLRRVIGQTADNVLRDALLRILRPTAQAGAEEVARSLGLNPSVDAGHPLLARLVSDRLPRIVGINDQTRSAVRAALLDVVSEGGSLEDQQRAIRRVMDDADRRRAQTIARTEAGTFWHSAGRVQADELGARSHVWISTRDQRVREAHAQAEGQCQPIAVAYIVDGEPLRFPLDPQGSPGNIINCRCTEAFQVSPCEGRSLSYGQLTIIWKSRRLALGPWERLTRMHTRRVFRDQRIDLLVTLGLLAGATS